jgi:nicotinate phosphoribosyltransferase
MAFFFRRLPPHRNYVVACGLRSALELAARLRFDDAELTALDRHPLIGPALAARPQLRRALEVLDGLVADVDAVPEGTPAFAGPGLRSDGRPLEVEGRQVSLYTPLVQVRTDLVTAKLIETPFLSRLNHQSMVASKAARVVTAAKDKPVLEFGSRRTHPAAAVDAAYAAYVAGCAATSNLLAGQRFGVPSLGTMDHFAVQAAERPGVPLATTEREAFAGFARAFPSAATLLVDTYDTDAGIRHAVEATSGQLAAVRLDSSVTPESVRRARELLDALGARKTKIFVSDALDETRVAALEPVCDGFGVGENIVCSPDAATGIGAVAKLVINGSGKKTMKLAGTSGKATLPGWLQVYRFADHDLIALAEEAPPSGGRPLLEPVWRGRGPATERPTPIETRAACRRAIDALPSGLRGLEPARSPWPLVASDALADEIARCTRACTA